MSSLYTVCLDLENLNSMADMDTSLDISMSLPDEEDFMDYYIRMEQVLQIERDILQATLKAQEEEDIIAYYAKMCEENELNPLS